MHNNYGLVSFLAWTRRWSENLFLVPHQYLMPPLRVLPLEFCDAVCLRKVEWCSWQVVKRIWRYVQSLRRSTRVCVRETDTHRIHNINTARSSKCCRAVKTQQPPKLPKVRKFAEQERLQFIRVFLTILLYFFFLLVNIIIIIVIFLP